MGAPDRLLHRAGRQALRLREVEGLVHGLVPGLLLGVDVERRVGGCAVGIGVSGVARAGIHDLAGAGGIDARGSRRSRLSSLDRRPRSADLLRTSRCRRWSGHRRRDRPDCGSPVTAAAATRRRWRGVLASTLTVVLLRLRQAVVGLLDADPVPGLGVGRELEARVAQEAVGDELRGLLPAAGLALAPAGVVLERAGQHHAADRGLDEVRAGVGHPLGRVADLVAVARQRLAGGVGADRQPEREAAEEGLVLEQGRDAVADPARRFLAGAAGHHAASRWTPAPSPK